MKPVEWTRKNRARILAALFTILMASRPCVKVSDRKTRFKQVVVGSRPGG